MSRALVVLTLLVVAAAGCSNDDGASPDSTSPSPVTSAVETTSSLPSTTSPPPSSATPTSATSPPPTTAATTTTTTTISEEDLRAQIARDYQRSWRLRREITENPALKNLDAKVARISAPRSSNFRMLRDLVRELVRKDEHIVPGTPDEFQIEVENVDLRGPADAVVTICYIRNRVRVDADGNVVLDPGIVASRSEDHVVLTRDGWLPDGDLVHVWEGLGVTECPPA